MDIFSVIVFLCVASACAYLGERLIPSVVPGGFIALAVVAIIGAGFGGSMTGHLGPDLAGVSLIPCMMGSAILVLSLSLLYRDCRRST